VQARFLGAVESAAPRNDSDSPSLLSKASPMLDNGAKYVVTKHQLTSLHLA